MRPEQGLTSRFSRKMGRLKDAMTLDRVLESAEGNQR
jgi:hypothetical protein